MNGVVRGRRALVAYGTETGTAQDLAEEGARMLERLHFVTDVIALDEISISELGEYELCLFVVATTGQGDFPSNARSFWRSLLKKRLPSNLLADVDFALIGLGDTSYPRFNWAGRKLNKRLRQLGATSIIESCEADEQGDEGIDGAFLAWWQLFSTALLPRFPMEKGQPPIPNNVLLPAKWILRAYPAENVTDATNGYLLSNEKTAGNALSFNVTLTRNNRLTPSSYWQDVRLLRLTTSECIHYLPGDALGIYPKNPPMQVDALIKLMNWTDEADSATTLIARPGLFAPPNPRSRPSAWPRKLDHLTFRKLVSQYLDIQAVPRRSFFSKIARYTDDISHKERLLEFTDPQYLDEYYDYATRSRRSMLEVLQEFSTVKIPWQEAINVFPALRPRQFSIASGGNLRSDPNGGTTFELLVAIVKYRTVIKKVREGVCTQYLANLPVGSRFDVQLHTEGRFHQSVDSRPQHHLLIGAGTGVAPLRSLIHEKCDDATIGDSTALFFGSRSRSADFFFQAEWESLQDAQPECLQIVTAFSRDQNLKVYVQDRVRENATTVYDYICSKGATLIVCGSSGAMPKAVREAIMDCLIRSPSDAVRGASEMTRQAAEAYLDAMEKQGRFKQETW